MKKMIFALTIALLFSCGKKHSSTRGKLSTDLQTHPLVEAYTSGFVGRTSSIRVVFVTDLADSSRLQSIIQPSPFTFSPKLQGETYWADRRTLEFRPSGRLAAGVTYQTVLDPRRLSDVDLGSAPLTFRFSTIVPAMEVLPLGFIVDGDRLQFEGRVSLSEIADIDDPLSFFQARLGNKELPLLREGEDRRAFRFRIAEVPRSERPGTLFISWNGKSAGIEGRGTLEIPVPAKNAFELISARAVQEEGDFIELRFSQALAGRSFTGLVQVDNSDNLRFSADRNVLRIYGEEPFAVGEHTVTVHPALTSIEGKRLERRTVRIVNFAERKPSVRFLGKGVILPTTQGATLPIEAVNLSSVLVTAVRIPMENVPQFLQVNDLGGEQELRRVGREVWKKRVDLTTPEDGGSRRYGLDLTPLIKNAPSGLYRLTLSFRRPQIIYPCAEAAKSEKLDESLADWDDEERWNYEEFGDFDWGEFYSRRFDPCHPAYYYPFWDHDVTVAQNVLISDIGLLAKRGGDTLWVAAADLKSTVPLRGVKLTVLNYQRGVIASATTNDEGLALIPCPRKPFLLIGEHKGQISYLKLNDGSALSLSRFDVGGERPVKGMRGFLYAERGVRRPGDPIYVTLILWPEGRPPEEHPAILELIDPRGRLVASAAQKSVDGFYSFRLATSPDAPTGNWTARCTVGGAVFQKTLKIETIMPNRLEAQLDFGDREALGFEPTFLRLSARWLFGAKASGLKAKVELRLTPQPTRFSAFPSYTFDNPAAPFTPETVQLFDGRLNEEGRAEFPLRLHDDLQCPGKLAAVFDMRIFEPGGAFSTSRKVVPLHRYHHYIGISVPVDSLMPVLAVGKSHRIDIVRVTSDGRAEGEGLVEATLLKIRWRWWWEKAGEEAADFVAAPSYRTMSLGTFPLRGGRTNFEIRVPDEEWGRYLLRVRDLESGHTAGRVLYFDQPEWIGRSRADVSEGAAMLVFTSDKTSYQIGEKATLTIPTSPIGRGLVTLECGDKILHAEWFEPKSDRFKYRFKVTPDMAPTVYASVSLLQPHLQTANDLPIRLYGVIPISVVDPQTRLKPIIACSDEIEPETPLKLEIREAEGRAMTYTLALVDQGLLDLTRFTTPDPWQYFYGRTGLAVKTWDLYDWVIGAYGGRLERLLGIGGGETVEIEGGYQANRFPPLVLFEGPFRLKKGETRTHTLTLPMYVGAARIMVVAGSGRAFGATEKRVTVRKSLTLISAPPRGLGVQEQIDVPVTVFADDPAVKQVEVRMRVEGAAKIIGESRRTVEFRKPGEQTVTFSVGAGEVPGVARLALEAEGGGKAAHETVELPIRNPMRPETISIAEFLQPQTRWSPELRLPGKEGTNRLVVELSHIPPLDLSRRLGYLMRYPHGCVEQITSAVFPQLYLNRLLDLSEAQLKEIDGNIRAALRKLAAFQTASGGFAFWPAQDQADEACTNYVVSFLLAAQKLGYTPSGQMLEDVLAFQQKTARTWRPVDEASLLIQADRLYTLAAAGRADLASMNRLKELSDLTTVCKWRLSAAYLLAGQEEAARQLNRSPSRLPHYRESGRPFGSELYHKALMLQTATLLRDQSKASALTEEIVAALAGEESQDTYALASALSAVAEFAGLLENKVSAIKCTLTIDGRVVKLQGEKPLLRYEQGLSGGSIDLQAVNTGLTPLYARVLLEGTPELGREEAAADGLDLSVRYLTAHGQYLQPDRLRQGRDFLAQLVITNTGLRDYDYLALTHLMPSGWEIHNERLFDDATPQWFDYQDIRDDRIYTYFSLKKGESRTMTVRLTAAYLGRFYQPPISVEAMYDPSVYARTAGEWVLVESSEK